MTTQSSTQSLAANQRSVKNYVLQPLLQVKLGLYCVTLAVVFSVLMGAILYVHLQKFMSIVLELTGVEDEVRDLLSQSLAPARWQIAGILIVYVLVTIVVSIKYTHRLVGPTIAFRRHIRMLAEGNWQHRTKLRDGDAFQEVSQDFNKLSEYFSKKYPAAKP